LAPNPETLWGTIYILSWGQVQRDTKIQKHVPGWRAAGADAFRSCLTLSHAEQEVDGGSQLEQIFIQ
jgi:hypothetical protein